MRVTRLTEYYVWRIGINGLCPQCIHTNERRVLHNILFQHNVIMVWQYCSAEAKRKRKTITEMYCTSYNVVCIMSCSSSAHPVVRQPSTTAELQMSTRRIMRGTLYVY